MISTKLAAGFTLIELSIVLVVIGLLTGGILTGRELIQAAQRRTIISEVEHFKTAVYTFRVKYNEIPGDMIDATTFWGSFGGTYDAYSGNPGSTLTFNGNGDGTICGPGEPDTYADITCDDEPYLFWKHLANAGLISASVTGSLRTDVSASLLEFPGINMPASAVNSTYGYLPINLCLPQTSGGVGAQYFYNGICTHVFLLGTAGASVHNWTDLVGYPALSPFDAKSIDAKIDDGLPATGGVTTFAGNTNLYDPQCATTANAATAAYNTALSSPQCSLMFNAGF